MSDRWVSIVLSVLLHGALLAALVWGWLLFRRPPRPAPTLAIEATVVDARAMRGAQPQRETAPPPPPQEALGPPQPTVEELAQREQERRQAEETAATAAKEAAEKQAAEEQAAKEAETRRQAEAALAAQLQAQKRAAEQQRKEEVQEEKEREEDLQRSLAAEAESDTARAGPALANWEAQIAAKITRAWLRPPTARPGIECMLNVTQVPGGEVTQVTIGECNADEAVRESIEAAVYRASPLPPPPDPALFDRNLKIDFKPD
ncbi:MAG TPA: cell envelope integrity protein TolA [Steroidobacteraceae bacterium]|nr:cell envelope integrity protein TolA [Steroidobacteraceae bacterium]